MRDRGVPRREGSHAKGLRRANIQEVNGSIDGACGWAAVSVAVPLLTRERSREAAAAESERSARPPPLHTVAELTPATASNRGEHAKQMGPEWLSPRESPSVTREKGSPAPRAEALSKQCSSPDGGGVNICWC
ncbi:hypothetical protein NDU88_005396 [Pleurodeles waltl]|uniref:Uncharacterized protein n=1 Tax=Pleurodeles waltl TaxID=8319 RepID=A0AAV7TBG4_PLEWA|nr:hypothetical protein NDU88_005396 [Pleurodeles waltl]